MSKSLSLPRRLGHVARMIAAFAGPPLERWSPRPPLPAAPAPTAHDLGHGITLWRLPVGVVRIRERHRALPADLADVDDKLRFPVMMSDRRITGWLDCTAWLIDHPERRILVDTGESAGFGSHVSNRVNVLRQATVAGMDAATWKRCQGSAPTAVALYALLPVPKRVRLHCRPRSQCRYNRQRSTTALALKLSL